MRLSVIGCGYLGARPRGRHGHPGPRRRRHRPRRAPRSTPSQDGRAVLRAGLPRNPHRGDGHRPAALQYRHRGGPRRAGPLHRRREPRRKKGEDAADLTYVNGRRRRALPHLSPPATWWSASPPCRSAPPSARRRARRRRWTLAWNPEFLREGFAVQDTLHPDRLVSGVPSATGRTRDRSSRRGVRHTARRRHRPLVTDYATAELVKVAANSFLATKISFINAMAEICPR